MQLLQKKKSFNLMPSYFVSRLPSYFVSRLKLIAGLQFWVAYKLSLNTQRHPLALNT